MAASILDYTLELARQGVRFFRVVPNTKIPAIKNFSKEATADEKVLASYFSAGNFNSGIACGKVKEGFYLVGFDIDYKDGRNGHTTLEELERNGKLFEKSWSQTTPTGGEHRLYWSPIPIKQCTGAFGKNSGIDIRSEGGYLVGPGSRINGKSYQPTGSGSTITRFPDWAIEELKKIDNVVQLNRPIKPVGDQILALQRSIEYLQSLDASNSGGRNNDCYVVVCKLKDFGLAQEQILDVLFDYWKCEPMIDHEEAIHVINSAFHYAQNPPGVEAPENIFEKVTAPKTEEKPKHPFEKMNEEFFYSANDGVTRVCWETTKDGKFHLERFPVPAFHEKYAARTMEFNGKSHPITKLWMTSPMRRTYDFIRFDPSNSNNDRTYNMWKGFAVKPVSKEVYESEYSSLDERAIHAVDDFLAHCLHNICAGDAKLNDWLIGFFAHIFQYPGEKPQVALVFKGSKGSGKSALIERLNFMIGDAAVVVSDKTHIANHFNSIMEGKLLFTMDEAFWSGDKSVEGILKTIITGQNRVITRKGAEPYMAPVFDRIVIIGNEDWLVPATADERRFAVFNVANGKRMDAKFFVDMKTGMEKYGGAKLLMRYFLDYDLSKVDINVAPETEGLKDQKESSLNSFESFWFECLQDEKILYSGFDQWPADVSCRDFYDAYVSYCDKKRLRYPMSKVTTSKQLRRFAASVVPCRTKVLRSYIVPLIDIARLEWDRYIGHTSDWN